MTYQGKHVRETNQGMRTFLVAVVAPSHEALMEWLPTPDGDVDCWWVAEDDRQDGSDNDSAIFVPYGAQKDVALLRDGWALYHEEDWRENGYPYAATDVSGVWFNEVRS